MANLIGAFVRAIPCASIECTRRFLSLLTVFLSAVLALGLDSKPYGIEKREVWMTSKVIGTPDRPAPYITESAFPKLQFDHAVDLVPAPGTDRLYVAEHQTA